MEDVDRSRVPAQALALGIVAVCLLATAARGDALWIENAESGYANIIDGTNSGYPLIQSSVAGEGNYAFHLSHISGNPFDDQWFELDTTLPIAADTKLFFLSRLRYSAAGQRARAQISTNSGGTWTNLASQQGSGGPGEGAFSLKQIDLSAYANQNARFRFNYDFVGGSYFAHDPAFESSIGWFVDNIQVGDAFEKAPWSIGNPTAHEQQYLEYVNRARSDALVEANRLRNETNADVQFAYSTSGINVQNIVDQFTWSVNNGVIDRYAQPLSFQAQLLEAAELHSLDQFQRQFQGHNSSSTPPAPFQAGFGPGQRAQALGYSFQSIAENVYAYAKSAAHGHAGFDVDWGNTTNSASPDHNPAFAGQGMQNPAGHRINIHNDDFKEVGIGVMLGTNGPVGPQVVTQDFGYSGDVRYITGVVFEDLNANDFYDIGEGRSGVRVDVEGSPFYALSSTSGGYSIPVPQDGAYDVAFTGGGFASYSTSATVASGKNVKVDYLAMAAPLLLGDYNNDGFVNAADYTVYRNRRSGIGGTTLPNDAGAAGVTIDDYNYWKAHYGDSIPGGGAAVAVPEPNTAIMFLIGGIFFVSRPRRW
jgi:uncharacterized protein YkwD